MHEKLIEILNKLLITHSPAGLENEMDEIIKDYLDHITEEETIHDHHGNIYIKFSGREEGKITLITAHKDELSTMVRRIDEDGKIWLEPLCNYSPAKYGEGPFDLITASEVIEGVLCVGSAHVSHLSSRIHSAKTGALNWEIVYLDCKLDRQELEDRGVMIGDRAVIGRKRKMPMYLHDKYVCGYALDDKGAVAILLLLAQKLSEKSPIHDVYLAFTSSEETGASGAAYISRKLDTDDLIAVEIAPVADEYTIEMNKWPVILFKDAVYQYNLELSKELINAGKRCYIEIQPAIVRGYGSDASVTNKIGLNGRPACIAFPTENTHGYEIAPLAAMENCVEILFEHLH